MKNSYSSWKFVLARVLAKVKKNRMCGIGVSICLHAVIILLLSLFWISQETQETKAITVAVAEVFWEDLEEQFEFELSFPEEKFEQERSLALAEDMSEVSISDPAEAFIVEAAHVNAPPSMEVLLQEIETPVSIPAAEEGTPGQSGRHAAGYRSGDGGSGTGQGGYVSFFGATVQAQRMVFVLDASTSMEDPIIDLREEFYQHYGRYPNSKEELQALMKQGKNYPKRFPRLLAEATASINSLGEDNFFGIIFFHKAMLEWGMRGGNLTPASHRNKEKALRWMAEIKLRGGTWPLQPLLKALESEPDVIFFLTDGEFNPSIIKEITEKNINQVPIVVIGLGELRESLKMLAENNGGTWRHVVR